MYIACSSAHSLLTLNLPCKVILRRFGLCSSVWSESAALFKRLMKNQVYQYYIMALMLLFIVFSQQYLLSRPISLGKLGVVSRTDPDPIAMVIRVELFIDKPCRQKTPVTWSCMSNHAMPICIWLGL